MAKQAHNSSEERRYREAFNVFADVEVDRYTPFQLRVACSLFLQRPVKENTIRTWRRRIGITPDDGYYGKAEVQHLLNYLAAKTEGKTTKQFNLEKFSS